MLENQLKNYPNLASLAQARSADNTTVVSLARSTGATREAIQLVDQQITAISYAHIQGNFTGASEMAHAIIIMKTAAAAWPATKSAIIAAAQETVNAGPAAASLGAADNTTAQQMAIDVKDFVSGILNNIVSDFASAKTTFDAFNEGLDQVYSASADANRAAADAIKRDQEKIEAQIKDLQAEENDLKSAGSVILGILSFGATTIAKLNKLKQEAEQLKDEKQQHQYDLSCYQVSLSSFKNALDATKLASYALSTLSTSLQQAMNSVDDIAALTSDNLAVMQAELQQFKTEFAGAVTHAQKLTA